MNGSNSTRNFTARALPQIDGGDGGSGRLFYETPVIHVMGRELTSFTDLQKNLAQLGFNSGSVLLRLSFRATQRPLEEAMAEIDQYFKSLEAENTTGAHESSAGNAMSTPGPNQPVLDQETKDTPSPAESTLPESRDESHHSELTTALSSPEAEIASSDPSQPLDNTITGPFQRPIQVFAPPSTSTPAAAHRAYDERDYEPTVDHAKLHQARLSSYGRNKTLPSDAKVAAQSEAQARKKAEVKSVNIKVRFPDQSTVISEFNDLETPASLYDFVQQCLENENEPFSLNFSTAKGPQKIVKETSIRLISGLGMMGSVVVNVIWEEDASSTARAGKDILKEMYRKRAAEINVKEPERFEVEDKDDLKEKGKEPPKREGQGKKGGVPKWFKLGKKI